MAEITIEGKKLINLSSNNYLGLATDETLKKVAKEAIDSHGVGQAPCTINGTLDLHVELEDTLAESRGLKRRSHSNPASTATWRPYRP